MNADVAMVFPAIVLFSASMMLTGVSLWLGGKMAPWFMGEGFEAPTVRSYFTDLSADMDLTKGRVVTAMIALAIMLAALLTMAVAVKFGGIAVL